MKQICVHLRIEDNVCPSFPSLPSVQFWKSAASPGNTLDNPPALFQIPRMVAVNSTMLPLGTAAPDFRLPDTSGKTISLSDFKGKPLLVMFICNHCPFVKHVRDGLAQLGRDYLPRGAAIAAVSSNDVEGYPADSPDKMREEAKAAGYLFPYLYDESQAVAKAYHAACTPDFFLFDKNHRLVYRGQLDDSRPGNGVPVTGKDLRAALDAVLAAKPVAATQKPSIGCNIKWKSGNEPDYF
jgi:peroxiredoxin